MYIQTEKKRKNLKMKIINLTQNLKPHLTNEVLLNAIERLRESANFWKNKLIK